MMGRIDLRGHRRAFGECVRPLFRLAMLTIALLLLSGCNSCPPGQAGLDLGFFGSTCKAVENIAERKTRAYRAFALSEVVSAGGSHTCARGYDKAYCWGDNLLGQLGVGVEVPNTSTPQQVLLPSGVVHTIFAGLSHSCASVSQNSPDSQIDRQQLFCWGRNHVGQLGVATPAKGGGDPDIDPDIQYTPVEVPLIGIVKIDGDGDHTCALQGDLSLFPRQGGDEPKKLFCWGANTVGQATGTPSESPAPITEITPGGYRDVAVGFAHTCAITASGTVTCWGRNPVGGEAYDGQEIPGLSNAQRISAGFAHTCAITPAGTQCWGRNSYGELGDGTTTASEEPRLVPGQFEEVSAGVHYTCARRAGGGAQCWGNNSVGQLGNGTTRASNVPADVRSLTNVTDISAGATHSCAVSFARPTTGTIKDLGATETALRCWGKSYYGELGSGLSSLSDVPQDALSAALRDCENLFFVLRPGCRPPSKGAETGAPAARLRAPEERGLSVTLPIPVEGFARNLTGIDAGSNQTCLLASGGVPFCWGANNNGEIGNDARGEDQFDPVTPAGLEGGVLSIAAGGNFDSVGAWTCAVAADGGVHCWGDNSFRQLADGTFDDAAVPQPVAGISGPAVKVAAGSSQTCVLLETGTVECWTDIIPGAPFEFPEPVPDLAGVIDIAVGEFHFCAVRDDGSVQCRGNFTAGAVGGPCEDAIFSYCIEEIEDIGKAAAVEAGPFASCTLSRIGGVSCWGDKPGNGECRSNNLPVPATGLEAGVSALAIGPNHSCAVLGDPGALYCWGANESGALGFEPTGDCFDTPTALEPTPVPGFETGVQDVAVGFSHTCVLMDDTLQCFGANDEGQLAGESVLAKGMDGELGPLVTLPELVDLQPDPAAGPTLTRNLVWTDLPSSEGENGVFTVAAADFFEIEPREDQGVTLLVHDFDGVLLPLDEAAADDLLDSAASLVKASLDENGDLQLRPSGVDGAVLIDAFPYYTKLAVGDAGWGSNQSAPARTRLFFGDGVDLSLGDDRLIGGISVRDAQLMGGVPNELTAAIALGLVPVEITTKGVAMAAETDIDLSFDARNEGPFDVSGARFLAAVNAPADAPPVTWTCSVPVGVCTPAMGEGDIDTIFDLAVGETARIRLLSTGPEASGYLDVQASLEPPPGITAFLSDDDTVIQVVPLRYGDLFGNGFE